MKKPFTWSWSTVDSFETCPRRHHLTKVIKAFPEQQNAQMLEGQRVHKALELRVARKKTLTGEYSKYEPMMQKIIGIAEGGTIEAEKKIGLTRDFKETGYFDNDVWLRSVLDVQIDLPGRALILDYKTGKIKTVYDQLALSAAVKFAITPGLKSVTTGYLWLNEAVPITQEKIVAPDVPGIWENMLPRVIKIEKALESGDFPPKPSGLCRGYCPCTGCEYYQEKPK